MSITKINGRYRLQFNLNGTRHTLSTPFYTRQEAETLRHIVETLIDLDGDQPGSNLSARIQSLPRKLRDRVTTLFHLGRIHGPLSIQEYVDDLANRSTVSLSTRNKWRVTRDKLVAYFGKQPMSKIRPADIDRWIHKLSSSELATATVHREIKRAKQFFSRAMVDGVITDSPFAHVKAGSSTNPERIEFIDRKTFNLLLDQATSTEWRAILLLSRIGMLRCPSEIVHAEWQGVNFDRKRFTFYSPKDKGYRTIPLFSELEQVLSDLFDEAEIGAVHIITMFGDVPASEQGILDFRTRAGHAIRNKIESWLRHAGIAQWPRLTHNMRASRIVELCNVLPLHVVASWAGNSMAVAQDHYLTVNDQHFDIAVKNVDDPTSDFYVESTSTAKSPTATD